MGAGMVRGLDWELEGKRSGWGGDGKDEGENYHDRHAVLYLGFTLTIMGLHRLPALTGIACSGNRNFGPGFAPPSLVVALYNS